MSKLTHFAMRMMAESKDKKGEDEHGSFGVHIEYEDLYNAVVFFTCIYLAGQIAAKIKMPSLVGEIVVGILLGPPLADFVPNPEAFVLLGEVGLVLLVLEAGIDIDVSTLNLIGTRGFIIAVVGSILPIGMGIILTLILNGFDDTTAALAGGAAFGPTSLGIALNILRSGGILNTPVGQLIVSAAVIDDMIALIVLSQLESLTGTIDAAGVLIPVVSALSFLIIGGYIALFQIPPLMARFVHPHVAEASRGRVELAIMFGILIGLMPATFYAKASYLMGAFVAGLSFCTSHDLHTAFVRQFKRLMQWLMRIFFAASIGFQVPIKDLFSASVIWRGLVFTLALAGKLFTGFLVPNFTQSKSFTGLHFRDCMVTGLSLAAEGEFAFVIAVFGVENELISQDLYASIVLAVLLSTIVPPFLLRFTISYYNKKAVEELEALANAEIERNFDLEGQPESMGHLSPTERQEKLETDIANNTAVFLCIQTQSEGRWGLIHNIMGSLANAKLEIIDHRSWHPRGINTTLMNEIYVKDSIQFEGKGKSQEALDKRMGEIKGALEGTIGQPQSARVKVQRWFPGVVEEVVEHYSEKSGGPKKSKKKVNLEERLLQEASERLNERQSAQIAATKERTVEEILAGMQTHVLPLSNDTPSPAPAEAAAPEEAAAAPAPRPRRRRRQKMRSTPVVGGGLFEASESEIQLDDIKETNQTSDDSKVLARKPSVKNFFEDRGHRAEIIVDGESYDIRIDNTTLRQIQNAFSGDLISGTGLSRNQGISIVPQAHNVSSLLQGYVRQAPASNLKRIQELDEFEDHSDINLRPEHHYNSERPATASTPLKKLMLHRGQSDQPRHASLEHTHAPAVPPPGLPQRFISAPVATPTTESPEAPGDVETGAPPRAHTTDDLLM